METLARVYGFSIFGPEVLGIWETSAPGLPITKAVDPWGWKGTKVSLGWDRDPLAGVDPWGWGMGIWKFKR